MLAQPIPTIPRRASLFLAFVQRLGEFAIDRWFCTRDLPRCQNFGDALHFGDENLALAALLEVSSSRCCLFDEQFAVEISHQLFGFYRMNIASHIRPHTLPMRLSLRGRLH